MGHHRRDVNDFRLTSMELTGPRLLLWGTANEDPAFVDASNDVRLDRPGGKAHVSLCEGVHVSVGAAPARLESGSVIGELPLCRQCFTSRDVERWLSGPLVRRLTPLDLVVTG